MRAVGWTSLTVNGAEASAIDLVEIADGAVRWSVTLPGGAGTHEAASADPAVVAFVETLLSCRTLPGRCLPTAEAFLGAPPLDPA